jgi:hypothetical protein
MKFLSHEEVLERRRHIEANELQMAVNLDVIYKGSLIWPMRNAIATLLHAVIDDPVNIGRSHRPQAVAKLHKTIASQQKTGKSLEVWNLLGRPTTGLVEDLKDLLKKQSTWSLEDCADIVRLFGKLVEELAKTDYPRWVARNHLKEKFRSETEKSKFGIGGMYGKQQSYTDKNTLGYTNMQVSTSENGKYRKRGPGIKDQYRNVSAETARKHEYLSSVIGDLHKKPGAGVNLFALRMGSAVGSIDKAFGLPFGADISGTTANALYAFCFIKTWYGHHLVNAMRVLPLLELLPLVSMVKNRHHTTLECALTLAVNDKIDDYCVGYYTSLWPKQASKHSEGGRVWECLEKAENSNTNHHMLVFTNHERLRQGKTDVLHGFEARQPDEIEKFKKLASMAEYKGYERFATSPNPTSAAFQFELMRDYGLQPAFENALRYWIHRVEQMAETTNIEIKKKAELLAEYVDLVDDLPGGSYPTVATRNRAQTELESLAI